MDDAKERVAGQTKPVDIHSRVKEDVIKWRNDLVVIDDSDGCLTVCLSLFPLHDHGVCIYVTEHGGKFTITDNGEAGGELFSNGYETTKRDMGFVKRICNFHGVTLKQTKNDDDVRSIGELVIEDVAPCDVKNELSHLFCAVVQIYAMRAIE